MNPYESHINGMVERVMHMYRVSDVIKEIRAIYYGNNEAQKRNYKRLMFLIDDLDAKKWVAHTLEQWEEIPMLAELDDNMNISDINKCLMVKSYRELCNQKKKAGEEISVSPDELIAQFAKDLVM